MRRRRPVSVHPSRPPERTNSIRSCRAVISRRSTRRQKLPSQPSFPPLLGLFSFRPCHPLYPPDFLFMFNLIHIRLKFRNAVFHIPLDHVGQKRSIISLTSANEHLPFCLLQPELQIPDIEGEDVRKRKKSRKSTGDQGCLASPGFDKFFSAVSGFRMARTTNRTNSPTWQRSSLENASLGPKKTSSLL